MKRAVSAFFVLGLLLAVASACDNGDVNDGHQNTSSQADCRAATTCGACTPLLGCGWCFIGGSDGQCVDGPDDCPSSSTAWTWDPPGCTGTDAGDAGHDAAPPPDGGHSIADAGVGSSDASGD